jgi:hypothetical protein
MMFLCIAALPSHIQAVVVRVVVVVVVGLRFTWRDLGSKGGCSYNFPKQAAANEIGFSVVCVRFVVSF